MNTLETLTAQMNANYNNDMYANDEDTQNALGLLTRAATLSHQAQVEFVKAWSFEFALDNQVYVPTPRLYPTLVSEAAAAGIQIVGR